MKKEHLLILISIVLISIAACKKGDKGDVGAIGPQGPSGVTVDQRIYNKWEVLSGGIYLTANYYYQYPVKYVQISNNNTFYFLVQDSVYGYRDIIHEYSLVNSSQICMIGCLNYSITGTGDTLYLVDPVQNTTTVLLKNTNAPSGDDWVKIIKTALDSFPIPSTYYYGGDIGYDGHYIWLADDEDYLYKLDPSTHSTANSFYLSMYAYHASVEAAGGYIWVGDEYGDIHKINPSTGYDLQQSSPIDNTSAYGIVWDNQYLRVNTGSSIYKYDKDNNYVAGYDMLPSSGFAGMAYANGSYYITDGYYSIYKISIAPFKVLGQYNINIPGTSAIGGLAFDGTNFWVAINLSSYTSKLYKVSLN